MRRRIPALLLALVMGATTMATALDTDILSASLGLPVVWAYGRHVVAGNVILADDSPSDHSVRFVALGEGEWDGVDSLLVNGVAFTDRTGLSDAQGFLFHPGKDGQTGTGGETGDQKISRWFPGSVTQTTYSRTAYLALWIPRDIYAPGPDIDVRGIFRTRKLQEYDGAGTPTTFQFSANPAWAVLDLLLNLFRVPTARIDFQSFVDSAAYCAAAVGGNPRFEAHVFFTGEDGGQALEALLATCRGFLSEAAGKLTLRIDQSRASVHDFSMANIAEGSFRFDSGDTRKKPNKLAVRFRDIANNYAEVEHGVDREAHQDRVGQVNRVELLLGNSRHGQAFRIGNYLLARAVDIPATMRLRGLADSAHLLPGDVVRVKHDAAPWTYASGQPDWKSFDVIEATDSADPEREFLLQEYSAAVYSDSEEASQALASAAVQSYFGAAGHVTGQAVSETALITQDGTAFSQCQATFAPPSPLGNWAGVEIWMESPIGGSSIAKVSEGAASPIDFAVPASGLNARFYFVSAAADGRRRAVQTSPNAVLGGNGLLDGQATAPPAPANFTGQAPPDQAPNVILSWDENSNVAWKDIAAYEIARRLDATAPGNGDVIGRVPATFGATKKAQYTDSPGAQETLARYYVRAVLDTIDPATSYPLASAWTGPATVTPLAPDGTTDTEAPEQGAAAVFTNYAVGGPGSPNINFHAGSIILENSVPIESIRIQYSLVGIREVEFEVLTYSNVVGTTDAQTRYFRFACNSAEADRFVIELENRYLKHIKARWRNYFGWEPGGFFNVATYNSPLPRITSQSEDNKPLSGNYDPATQVYGFSKLEGNTTRVTLTTNNAAGVVEVDRDLDLVNSKRLLVAGVASKGQLITDDGSMVKRLAVSGVNGRVLMEDSAQALGIKWGTAPGITSLNGLTDGVQTFATSTSGTDFAITSAAGVHTFVLPNANGSSARGLVSTGAQTFGGRKTFPDGIDCTGGMTVSGGIGTNLSVTGTIVASGKIESQSVFRCGATDGYNSDITIVDEGGTVGTLHVKGGLVTGYTSAY